MSATKRREIEREDKIGSMKVAATSKKQKNEDPLPFLRKLTGRFGSGTASQPLRKR